MAELQTLGQRGVSVITPVFNEADYLRATVPSILNLAADEWIFVDDGSSDGSPDILSSLIKGIPRAHLIRFPTNRGRAIARNMAIEAATEPWLAFVNANVRPGERFLEKHFETLKKYPDAVASVGRGVPMNPDPNDPYHRYLQQNRRGPKPVEGPVPWRYFLSGGLVICRDCVTAVGSFPDQVAYGVDPALASRLRRTYPNGLVYSPEASFEMLDASSLEEILNKLRGFGESLARMHTEDPTILSWTRLGFIEKAVSGSLVRSERIARLARLLAQRARGIPLRLAIRYLLAHATAIGFHSASRIAE